MSIIYKCINCIQDFKAMVCVFTNHLKKRKWISPLLELSPTNSVKTQNNYPQQFIILSEAKDFFKKLSLTNHLKNSKLAITFILLFSCSTLFAQDLEQIGVKKGVKVNGGISTSHFVYSSNSIENRADPYFFVVNGNLNFDFFGVSVPLSFAYSNQELTYRQPFNIIGASPKYKWIQAHVGYRNMTFSPYTLNGHLFLGAGLELTPTDHWEVKMMYGRLNKAIEYDPELSTQPFYKRMGAGVMATYKNGNDKVFISSFSAKDDVNSLIVKPDAIGVTPQQNAVISIGATKQLLEKVNLDVELARSALTRDIRSEDRIAGLGDGFDRVFYIPSNNTTVYYNAFKSNLNYQIKASTIGVGYERIDPGYQTLGAYYFNNDLENVTVNFGSTVLKQKVRFNVNVGGQRNNLDGTKLTTMKRFIGAVNLGITASQKTSISAGYSNFSSYANIITAEQRLTQLTPFDNYDTLNFVQISHTANAGVQHRLRTTEKVNSAISVNGNYQQTGDQQGDASNTSRIYSSNANYTQTWKEPQLSLMVGTNWNLNKTFISDVQFYGGTVGVTKAFLEKKLQSNVSLTINNSLEDGVTTARLASLRVGNTLTIKKQHSVFVNLNYLYRQKLGESEGQYNTSFSEMTLSFGYGYTF